MRLPRLHIGAVHRVVPLLGPLAIVAAMEAALWQPTNIWWAAAAIVVIIVAATAFVTNFERIHEGWLHTVASPLFLSLASLFLLLFLRSPISRQLVLVAVVALLFPFWENLWRYYWAPESIQIVSLENTSLIINTAVMWLTASLLYHVLLDPAILPGFWGANALALATGLVLLLVVLLDYGTLWVRRYPRGKTILWLVAAAVVVSQVFWATNFLPHRSEVKTYLIVLTYYLFTHLGRAHLDGTLRREVVRRYAFLGGISLIAVFVTARWLV